MAEQTKGLIIRKKNGGAEEQGPVPGTKTQHEKTEDGAMSVPEPLAAPATHGFVEQLQATPIAEAVAIDPTLLANFTHQIINPLNGVVGTLDNLIDGTIQIARRDQRLRAVRGQLVGAIELVRNLAYLSDLSTQGGREGLKSKAADVYLPKIIIEAAQFLQEMAEIRGLSVKLLDPATQYVVIGHAALLRQVFTNIVENGVKYSDEGSKIQIQAHPQKHTNHLLVEVTNYGPGFDANELQDIFKLGFRGAEAQKIKASGSGIGLFICKQILDLHDAPIEAEYSAKTRLTLFRIRFPSFRIDEERTEKEIHRARKPKP